MSPRKAVGLARGNINPLTFEVMAHYSPSKVCLCVCVCVREGVRVWEHHWYNTFKVGVVAACTCPSSTVQAHSPLHSDRSPLRHKGWVGPVMGGNKQYYPLGVQAKMPTYSSSRKSAGQFKPPTLAQHGKLPHQTPHQYLFMVCSTHIPVVVCLHSSQMMAYV